MLDTMLKTRIVILAHSILTRLIAELDLSLLFLFLNRLVVILRWCLESERLVIEQELDMMRWFVGNVFFITVEAQPLMG